MIDVLVFLALLGVSVGALVYPEPPPIACLRPLLIVGPLVVILSLPILRRIERERQGRDDYWD